MQSLDRLFGREIHNLPAHPQLKYAQQHPHHHHHHHNHSLAADIHPNIQHPHLHQNIHPNISQQIQRHKFSNEKEEQQQSLKEGLTQYFDEAMGIMLQEQSRTAQIHNYLLKQTEINDSMRVVLLDWLVDIHLKFKMFPETLFITTAVIDKYLSLKYIKKSELQLLGSAALYIAAKYQETYNVPEAKELIKISARIFTKEELLKMEADILKALDFSLIFNTSFHFLQPFSKLINFQPKNFSLAQYSLELALYDMNFLKFKPSLIAASAIYLINKIKRSEMVWPDVLMAASGYEQKQLRTCAKQLCQLLQNASNQNNIKNLKKKFSLPKYCEVSKIRLQKKQKSKN